MTSILSLNQFHSLSLYSDSDLEITDADSDLEIADINCGAGSSSIIYLTPSISPSLKRVYSEGSTTSNSSFTEVGSEKIFRGLELTADRTLIKESKRIRSIFKTQIDEINRLYNQSQKKLKELTISKSVSIWGKDSISLALSFYKLSKEDRYITRSDEDIIDSHWPFHNLITLIFHKNYSITLKNSPLYKKESKNLFINIKYIDQATGNIDKNERKVLQAFIDQEKNIVYHFCAIDSADLTNPMQQKLKKFISFPFIEKDPTILNLKDNPKFNLDKNLNLIYKTSYLDDTDRKAKDIIITIFNLEYSKLPATA